MLPTDWGGGWDHVHLGFTAEDQHNYDRRIAIMERIPAKRRFISSEPLLGHIHYGFDNWERRNAIHQVIVGGESGQHARPSHPSHVRSARDQTVIAGIAFEFKQWGEWAPIETPAVGQIPMGYFEARDKGWIHNWDGKDMSMNCSVKIGKKKAGRLLDGREWNEKPQPIGLPNG
jgi:protein gp37